MLKKRLKKKRSSGLQLTLDSMTWMHEDLDRHPLSRIIFQTVKDMALGAVANAYCLCSVVPVRFRPF